jgi:acetyl/propionyl-CoA carboxylase alpha subunit
MATKLRITIGGQDFIATVDQQTVTIDGVDGIWTTTARADGRWSVTHGDSSATGAIVKTRGGIWLGLDGTVALAQVDSAGARPRARTSDADALRPPMSATVVRIHVAVGATVAEGDPLIVLEAMKMELPIRAPRAGTVTAVHCREGELVMPTTVLVDLE